MKRKFLALLLALMLTLSLLPAGLVQKTAEAEAAPVDQTIVQGGAILHCFDWSYNEIKAALPDIAAAGYAAVQTSPVQPAKDYNSAWTDTGGNWWKLYQPLDLCVAQDGQTWLGSKEELCDLCDEADEYGIKVIVDVVANHTANINGGGYTVSGTYNVSPQVAERLQDPDGSKNLYHTSENGVNDGSRYNMTQYHLSMPDLNTGNPVVQEMVLDFLKECVDCGVDGFRFDAAKHIELPGDSGCGSNFWPYVIGGIRDYAGADNLYIYGESLSGTGYDAWVNEFITYIGLTDNTTGNNALSAVKNQNAGALAVGGYTRGEYPQDYVIWAESHDTYETDNEDENTAGVPSDKIIRTWAIVGARANSTALFLARPNELMGKASSDTTWKSPAVAAINKFKTYYDGTREYFSHDQDAKVTWLEREGDTTRTPGVVIDKLDGAGAVSLTAYWMHDGTYADEITGNIFTVSNGTITGNVGPTGVAVVYKTTSVTPPTPSEFITADPIYFVPTGWWLNDRARFAMWLFNNNGGEFVSLTDTDGDGVYEGALAEGNWTGVVFVRMNPAFTENRWNTDTDPDNYRPVWDQTDNLVPDPGTNCFTITAGSSSGTWSTFGGSGTVNPDAGYYLVGTMTGWSVLPEYKMEQTGAETEEYMIEVPLLRTSKPFHSRIKAVYSPDGVTAAKWYPEGLTTNYGDYAGEIPQSGVYTVYFRPGYDGLSDWHDGCLYAERSKYFVTVNNADKNGTVTVDKDVAAEGETVTVTVTPNPGYVLGSLVYMCETGFNTGTFNTTAITGTTFAMPAENAAVRATFVRDLTLYGEDVNSSDVYVHKNGKLLYRYDVHVKGMPEEGLDLDSAEIFLSFDAAELSVYGTDGPVEWTCASSQGKLLVDWASDSGVHVANGDVLLSVLFERIGTADTVDIAFTQNTLGNTSELSYLENNEIMEVTAATEDGSITFEPILYGDANCDGKVTSADAALTLRSVVGLTELSRRGALNADVDVDAEITAEDAAIILRYVVKLITELPFTA